MLNLVRTLLRRGADRSNADEAEQSDQAASLPTVVSIEGLPDFQIADHQYRHENLPLMKWTEVESWLSALQFPASQALAWEAIERAWLLYFRAALGPRYRLRESGSAALLSSLDDGVASATLRYMERTLKRVAATLDDLAQIPPWGKDILIVFDDAESYYRYVSHYYPEAGEFAFSSGMYIDGGCAHFVTVKADLRAIEPVIAHEMTHSCLAHLPIPLWLNEGLAVNTEHRIAGAAGSSLAVRELRTKHLAFWNSETIQEFWSGGAFKRPDDGSTLAYDLARLLVAHFAKDWETFRRFVLNADAADAGAASAHEHLSVDLGVLVSSLLEKEQSPRWEPDPRGWAITSASALQEPT